MKTPAFFNATFKEETVANYQNQVPRPSWKPKVFPKKEIPRLARAEMEQKRIPVSFQENPAIGPPFPP